MSAPIRLEDLRTACFHAFDEPCPRLDDGLCPGLAPVTASEVASVLSDAELLGELVRRGIYPLDFMRWLGQHPVGPDGTAYFVGTGREPVGSVGEPP